jgi:hypothetical protein
MHEFIIKVLPIKNCPKLFTVYETYILMLKSLKVILLRLFKIIHKVHF